MKLILNKQKYSFKPAYKLDFEMLYGLADGNYECTLKQERNLFFHRKVFAVAKCICDNLCTEMDAYMMIKRCMVEAGEVETVTLLSGGIAIIPRSIAFENMSQKEFEQVYGILLDIGSKLLQCSPDDLDEQAQEYL